MHDPASQRRGGRVVSIAIILGIASAACTGLTGPGPRTPVPIPSTVGSSGVPVATPLPPSAGRSIAGPTFDPARVELGLRLVVDGLVQPLGIVDPGDGSGRLFVVEQGGLVRIVQAGRLLPAPFLDLHDRVSCCGERGLLGLAFAPGFGSRSSAFFVNYTDANGDTVVARGTALGSDPERADPASLTTVMAIRQPYANHNGGDLVFGPDGYLYIGMGDGGSGGDPNGNGQSLGTLLGKLLRIDVSATPPAGPAYAIPADNPFVGQSDARPEIWAFGLRNPWRFSFDRATGDLWIGDVGQNAYEEVDRAPAGAGRGADYGWVIMEGRHCYAARSCRSAGLTLPIAEYDHSAGDCAVVGGYVYRGSAYPMLDGVYLFGDECSGRIRAVAVNGPDTQTPTVLLESGHVISSFGEDEAGELYLADLASGELFQVTASAR